MTDEQILKRLAEIEGWESDERKGGIVYYDSYGDAVDSLDNWSGLGPLIEKYRPNMLFWDSENFNDKYRGKWSAELDRGEGVDESLPHAICLAIIEANGGMGDE